MSWDEGVRITCNDDTIGGDKYMMRVVRVMRGVDGPCWVTLAGPDSDGKPRCRDISCKRSGWPGLGSTRLPKSQLGTSEKLVYHDCTLAIPNAIAMLASSTSMIVGFLSSKKVAASYVRIGLCKIPGAVVHPGLCVGIVIFVK